MAANKITPAKMQTQQFEVNQLQSNLINAITALSNQLQNTPANGEFITDVKLQTGLNTVPHTLGTTPIGYIIISQNAAASIFLVSKSASQLVLNASIPVLVSLFTF